MSRRPLSAGLRACPVPPVGDADWAAVNEHSLFTRRMVWRLINQNSGGDSSKDSTRHLLSLWSDKKTESLVYMFVVEKIRMTLGEDDYFALVIGVLLKLLLQQLLDHPPSNDILARVDTGISGLISELISPTYRSKSLELLKTALFIRQLANCRMNPHLRHEKSFDGRLSISQSKRTETAVDDDAVISNLCDLVLKSSKTRQRIQRHLTLSACKVLGGHLESYLGEEDETFQFFFLDDYRSLKEQFLVVSQEKKREEENVYEEAGLPPIRRTEFQLFAYKHYKQQTPLELTPEELDQVVNTVVHPPEDDHRSRLIASKILIKLLVDMFCIDRSSAARLMISMVFEMLSARRSFPQVHAFNLLFNLSVHMNLMEKVVYGQEDSLDKIGAHDDGEDEGERAALNIALVQKDLYSILKEMLLWLLHNRISSKKVWAAGLNCLLYFITDNGRIDKEKCVSVLDQSVCMYSSLRLNRIRALPHYSSYHEHKLTLPLRLLSLDSRVIPEFLRRMWVSDEVRAKLVRMLVTFLWNEERLDISTLERACGIQFIIDEYCVSRCMEVRENLFAVLFFYVIQTRVVAKSKDGVETPSSSSRTPRSGRSSHRWAPDDTMLESGSSHEKSIRNLLQLMRLVEAPHYFVHLFKLGSFLGCSDGTQAVLTSLKEFFLHSDTRRLVSRKPDRRLLEEVCNAFVGLAMDSARLPSEFEGLVEKTKRASRKADRTKNGRAAHEGHLRGLLQSDLESERRAGAVWLFHLRRVQLQKLLDPAGDGVSSGAGGEEDVEPINWVDEMMGGLVRSTRPEQRRIYIQLVELSLLFLKANIKETEDPRVVRLMIDILNREFGRLIAYDDKPSFTENADGETHTENLMLITDVIFSLLMAPRGGMSMYRRTDTSGANLNVYTQFLSGTAGAAVRLLGQVDVRILKHLFLNLRGSFHKDALLSLLILIMRKCEMDEAALRELGTIAFFKKMLLDSNPEVAYFASKYLIEHLRMQEDNKYQAIFSHLLDIARQQNNDEVLSNYYLQVLAIMMMGDSTEKTRTWLRSTTTTHTDLGS